MLDAKRKKKVMERVFEGNDVSEDQCERERERVSE